MTSRARLALALMALLALIAVVYAPVGGGVFVSDDLSIVNTRLVERGTIREIFARPYAPVSGLTESRPIYYRPLTILTLRADYGMASFDARGYHVTNVLLHLCATIALLFAARRLGASAASSVAAAGLWALLPRSTECVAWVSGRADLLAALFAIAAIGLWPWYGGAVTRTARARAGLAGAAVLLGLLAKESAIAAAVAIAVGTSLGTEGTRRVRVRTAATRLAYLAVPLGIYAALRYAATRGLTSQIAPMGAEPRMETVLEAIGRYVEMTVDPWHPRTSIGLAGDLDTTRAAIGGAVVAVAIVLLAIARRRGFTRPSAGVAIGASLAVVSLALIIHVVPIVLVGGIVADRLLYLPLAGVALALAVASDRLSPARRKLAAAVVVGLAVSFAPVTRARALDYTDDIQFRVAAAEHAHPRSTSAKSALANVLRANAEFDLACRMHASAAQQLSELGPAAATRYGRALENLGGCYEMLGDYDAAAKVYRRLVAIRPDNARVHLAIGVLFVHGLAFDDAEASLRRALALDSTLESAKVTLAAIPAMRSEVARFDDEEVRREDRLGWARLLTKLGRVPDANRAWLDLALDRASSDDTAYRGFEFVLANANIASARRAAEAYASRDAFDEQIAREKFARRARDQRTIDRLRPRLEALAAR